MHGLYVFLNPVSLFSVLFNQSFSRRRRRVADVTHTRHNIESYNIGLELSIYNETSRGDGNVLCNRCSRKKNEWFIYFQIR